MADKQPELGDSMNMDQLRHDLDNAKDFKQLQEVIVEAPFNQRLAAANLFLAFVVLMFENPETGMIDRVAISDNELAHNTFEVTVVAFQDIKIPADYSDNIIVQTIQSGKMHDTTDWYYTFTPALTGDQARINQASAGVTYTAIYPLYSDAKKGVLSFSFYKYEHLGSEKEHEFMKQYTEMVAKALSKVK